MANSARNIPGKEQEVTFEEVNPLQNLQEKYEAKKKPINTALTVVLVAIVGYFAYDKLIAEPKENKAMTAISHAQAYFAQDSASKALNGDGADGRNRTGDLRITNALLYQLSYSGTARKPSRPL